MQAMYNLQYMQLTRAHTQHGPMDNPPMELSPVKPAQQQEGAAFARRIKLFLHA
jgi:hypothetical protein